MAQTVGRLPRKRAWQEIKHGRVYVAENYSGQRETIGMRVAQIIRGSLSVTI
jgi:hypothetical protein